MFKKIRLRSLANGVLDSIPVVSTIKANIEAKQPQQGAFDWQRLFTNIIITIIIFSYTYGKINGVEVFSFDELKQLLKLLM
jgi:hypothetical protein